MVQKFVKLTWDIELSSVLNADIIYIIIFVLMQGVHSMANPKESFLASFLCNYATKWALLLGNNIYYNDLFGKNQTKTSFK